MCDFLLSVILFFLPVIKRWAVKSRFKNCRRNTLSVQNQFFGFFNTQSRSKLCRTLSCKLMKQPSECRFAHCTKPRVMADRVIFLEILRNVINGGKNFFKPLICCDAFVKLVQNSVKIAEDVKVVNSAVIVRYYFLHNSGGFGTFFKKNKLTVGFKRLAKGKKEIEIYVLLT